jgi:VWFA-related protein
MVERGSIKAGPSPRPGGGRSGPGPGLSAAGGCLAAFLLTAVAAATAPSQDRPLLTQPLRHEVSVVLKLLQVCVTDKKGRPVEDLTLKDFAVTDDGQPVVLTDFERHALRASPEPPSTVEAKPSVAAGPVPALTRKFFLFFDFAFNTGRGLVKARTAALRFLDDKVGPGDEVGVLTYSMFKGVRVHEYLTRDQAKVREVVEAIGSKDVAGRASELELQYWTMAQEPLAGAGGAGELAVPGAGKPVTDPNRNSRTESKRIAQTYVLRLTALAKALRYVPGQKNLVLFSTGVPSSIIYGGQAGNPSSGAGDGRPSTRGTAS